MVEGAQGWWCRGAYSHASWSLPGPFSLAICVPECAGLFSSQHSTNACSGGFRYKPTISSSFSINRGSRETLKVLRLETVGTPHPGDGGRARPTASAIVQVGGIGRCALGGQLIHDPPPACGQVQSCSHRWHATAQPGLGRYCAAIMGYSNPPQPAKLSWRDAPIELAVLDFANFFSVFCSSVSKVMIGATRILMLLSWGLSI